MWGGGFTPHYLNFQDTSGGVPGSEKMLVQGPLACAAVLGRPRAGSLDCKKRSFRDPLHAPRFIAAFWRGPWIAKNARPGTPCLRCGSWSPSGGVPGSEKTLVQGPLACAAVHGRPLAGSLDRKKPSPRDPLWQ